MALWLLFTLSAWATPPTEAAVLVLVKVLSYDRALAERQGGRELVIGVVWDLADPLAASQAAEVMAAIRGLRGVTVGGARVTDPLGMPLGRTELATALPGVAAVVACGPVAAELAHAADAADRPVLALGDAVGHGAAVGLALRQARIRILVDRALASAQGMDPSPELLEVAELVGH